MNQYLVEEWTTIYEAVKQNKETLGPKQLPTMVYFSTNFRLIG